MYKINEKVIEVPLSDIIVDKDFSQARAGDASTTDVKRLVDSIESYGLKNPILVYKDSDDRYILFDGNHRFNAYSLLFRRYKKADETQNFEKIKCRIVEIDMEELDAANRSRESVVKEAQYRLNEHTQMHHTKNQPADAVKSIVEQIKDPQGMFGFVDLTAPDADEVVNKHCEAWFQRMNIRKGNVLGNPKKKKMIIKNVLLHFFDNLPVSVTEHYSADGRLLELVKEKHGLSSGAEFGEYDEKSGILPFHFTHANMNSQLERLPIRIQKIMKLESTEVLSKDNIPDVRIYFSTDCKEKKKIEKNRRTFTTEARYFVDWMKRSHKGLYNHDFVKAYAAPQLGQKYADGSTREEELISLL